MEDMKDLMRITAFEYGIKTPLPDDTVVAMAYVPYQQSGKICSPEQGIVSGTLFPELNKPFCCGKEV